MTAVTGANLRSGEAYWELSDQLLRIEYQLVEHADNLLLKDRQ